MSDEINIQFRRFSAFYSPLIASPRRRPEP